MNQDHYSKIEFQQFADFVQDHCSPAMKMPASNWPGNCHLVATLLVGFLGDRTLRVVRGHWIGPISEDCVIEQWLARCFVQHSWVETKRGRIMDPTRWVFENEEPYIYNGPSDHYDPGGNRWRQKMLQPPPVYVPGGREVDLGEYHQDALDSLGNPPGITVEMAHWLANYPGARSAPGDRSPALLCVEEGRYEGFDSG